MNEEIMYEYWWAGMPRSVPGTVKKTALSAGSARRLYEASVSELMSIEGISEKYAGEIVEKRRNWDVEAEYDKLMRMGIRFIPWYSDEYPERLKAVGGHPYALFSYGRLPNDDKPSVAVIGARDCSRYGRMNAVRFGADLAAYGVQIISGMAYGIDGIVQEEAIRAGGDSFAVLGCGVNICYPAANRTLYERLKECGGIISEYGIYTKPVARLFPPRNRVISALSDVVLVVEAREKSGTMITVDMALEQGREVAVIPGRISDPLSVGCINLWKQGAYPVTCAEDIMYLLDDRFEINKKSAPGPTVILSKNEGKVYENLEPYAKSIGEISEAVLLPFRETISVLVDLTVKGLAAETGKGYYVKTRDCNVSEG